ncbi:iron-sulfur cluster repair protein YtfE [Glaciecola sp. MF2-115]|uniref:iron-sulfur cluster repair protein YtfE n=1 Tax=Glaciecola sp. MF2-115 TaxID=3384827 RepID=UPI0039A2CF7D
MSYLDWSIGDIATQVPGATGVLFEHKINFCGDGPRSLTEVIKRKQLDENLINTQLANLVTRDADKIDYNSMSNAELIEHILRRYHEVHRVQLAELIRLAARVELVHFEKPQCPLGLAKHLSQMQTDLEQHMQKEENILFPILMQEFAPTVQGPISVMKEEHLDHMQDIETIYKLTNDVTLHPGACNTWTALYLGLQEFISDINMHIHVENDILFARQSY